MNRVETRFHDDIKTRRLVATNASRRAAAPLTRFIAAHRDATQLSASADAERVLQSQKEMSRFKTDGCKIFD